MKWITKCPNNQCINKANLRDLIAATGLVILLKLDSNHRLFSPCEPEIWWMTPKNDPAPLLCYFKLFAPFCSHWWIQAGVTVRKRQIWVKFDAFISLVTLKFDWWPWKTLGHLFYPISSFTCFDSIPTWVLHVKYTQINIYSNEECIFS